jgi:hypothetical protein
MLRKLPHSKSAPLECASLSLLAPCGAAACCRAREMYAHSRWRALLAQPVTETNHQAQKLTKVHWDCHASDAWLEYIFYEWFSS